MHENKVLSIGWKTRLILGRFPTDLLMWSCFFLAVHKQICDKSPSDGREILVWARYGLCLDILVRRLSCYKTDWLMFKKTKKKLIGPILCLKTTLGPVKEKDVTRMSVFFFFRQSYFNIKKTGI